MESKILILLLSPFLFCHIPGNDIDSCHLPVDYDRSNTHADINRPPALMGNARLVAYMFSGQRLDEQFPDRLLIFFRNNR
ncbi:hypothetical protein D3C80_2063280 [compost metagenome]